MAGESAVQIDHVEVFKPFGLEAQGLRGGVTVEDGDALHIALLEAHAHPVLKIDGGKQDQGSNSSPLTWMPRWACQGFHLRKFAIKASPSF